MKLSAIRKATTAEKSEAVRWRPLLPDEPLQAGDEVRLGTDWQPVPRSLIGTLPARADSVHGRRRI